MGEKLLLGRYIPYQSFVHQLDARAKLLATIFYLIILFFANNCLTYFLLILFTFLSIYLTKIPFSYFFKGVRPLIWLITFTALMQVLFTRGGTPLFSFWIFNISTMGLLNGIFIFMRFVLITVMSTVLTLTTEALELADAIEFFLTPLKRLNFPVHEMTLMLTLAMRFVPTMVDEAEVIMNAQRSRGVSFEEGTLMDRIRNFVPLLLPLFISSYDRAPQLATAMEARGYHSGIKERTKYRELIWKTADSFVMISLFFLFLVILFTRS